MRLTTNERLLVGTLIVCVGIGGCTSATKLVKGPVASTQVSTSVVPSQVPKELPSCKSLRGALHLRFEKRVLGEGSWDILRSTFAMVAKQRGDDSKCEPVFEENLDTADVYSDAPQWTDNSQVTNERGDIEFCLVIRDGENEPLEPLQSGERIGKVDGVPSYVIGKNLLSAVPIKSANAEVESTGLWLVNVQMNEVATRELGKITEDNIGQRLAIVENEGPPGNNVLVAPMVNTPITLGRLQITGNLSQAEAKILAKELQLGPFPYALLIVESLDSI